MQPTEIPPPRSTTGRTPPREDDAARELRDEVVELARALPGELRRLTVRSGPCEIEVEWADSPPSVVGGPAGPVAGPAGAAGTPSPAGGAGAEPGPDDRLSAVRAPLVGTFYVAPSPDADPFIRVGDHVEAGQTLGIVEAMKLMNPIVADEPGVVTEVLVGNAESVEFDQVLLYLRAAGRPG